MERRTMATAWMRANLTFCVLTFSGMACAAGSLPELGSTPAAHAGRRQQAQKRQPTIHPDDLISSRWSFRLSFIPVIATFMF
jgi:hypothetical protein